MASSSYASIRNLRFLLHEVHQVSALTTHSHFAHLDRESLDMMIDSAFQIADSILFPWFTEMDRQEPDLKEGGVKTHPKVRDVIQAMAESGWLSANVPLEHQGMQLPDMMNMAGSFVFQAANNGVMGFPGLTSGAARLILSFGSAQQKADFMSYMYSGQWQGTMALTEPQAGSSLSDIVTSAEPSADGSHYYIKGQKIFISAGDNDAQENVVHLLLARIKGAPAGTKGISLFIVPKKRMENGRLVFNDVNAAGLYHKMGQKASPAVHLMFGEQDNCRGYLVGEPNKGLSYMFQMMNEARLMVGVTSAGIASAAYYASLNYCKERPQGRRLNEKDPSKPPTLIINHPDVKRMLLMQKAIAEGSISLILETARYADLMHLSEGEERENYSLLLDLLTPVAKTYPSEAGIQSVSAGLQCLGGYGFCKDFPLEQLYRDIRITAIYEGTTGIQGQDLLGRKIVMKQGKAAMLYMQEINKTIEQAASYEALKPYASRLENEIKRVQQVTGYLLGLAAEGDPERFLADATLYLEMFGIVSVAWQWLKQGIVAQKALIVGRLSDEDTDFYEGKVLAMQYFFHYEVPKTLALATRLTDATFLTIAPEKEILI